MHMAPRLTAETLADLRYGLTATTAQLRAMEGTNTDIDEYFQTKVDELRERRDHYAHELLEEHTAHLDNYQSALDAANGELDFNGEEPPAPAPPSLVEDEIIKVSRELEELETYRRKLIVYAHGVDALRPSQSELSRLSGATRVTVSRWLKDPDLRNEVMAAVKVGVANVLNRHGLTGPVDPNALDDHATHAALWALQSIGNDESPSRPGEGTPISPTPGGNDD